MNTFLDKSSARASSSDIVCTNSGRILYRDKNYNLKKVRLRLLILFMGILVMVGCEYRKGDIFYLANASDSLRFVVRKAGSGKKILKKLEDLREAHNRRQDECQVVFLSDSMQISDNKSVLLFHSEMPDFEDDMLTKGYLGAFGTKEVVTYMIVNQSELDHFFVEGNTRN